VKEEDDAADAGLKVEEKDEDDDENDEGDEEEEEKQHDTGRDEQGPGRSVFWNDSVEMGVTSPDKATGEKLVLDGGAAVGSTGILLSEVTDDGETPSADMG